MKMMIHLLMIEGDVETGMNATETTEEVVEMKEIGNMIGTTETDMIEGMTGGMIEGIEIVIATEMIEIGETKTRTFEEKVEVVREIMIKIRTEIGINLINLKKIGLLEIMIDQGNQGIKNVIETMTEAESTICQTSIAIEGAEAVTTLKTGTNHTGTAQNQTLGMGNKKIILRMLV